MCSAGPVADDDWWTFGVFLNSTLSASPRLWLEPGHAFWNQEMPFKYGLGSLLSRPPECLPAVAMDSAGWLCHGPHVPQVPLALEWQCLLDCCSRCRNSQRPCVICPPPTDAGPVERPARALVYCLARQGRGALGLTD